MLAAMEAEQRMRTDRRRRHRRHACPLRARRDRRRPRRLARRAGHAQDRRSMRSFQLAWQEFGRQQGIDLPNELAIAFAGPVGGEVLKLTNNPVGDPAGADQGAARRRPLHDRQRLRRGRLCGRDARRTSISSICADRTGRCPTNGVISIVGPGTGLGVAALLRKSGRLRGDRDRGRPCRLRAARQSRGPHPRRASPQLPPRLGRADRLGQGPVEHLRSARRDRGAATSPSTTRRSCGRLRWRKATASQTPRSTASA